jgi:spore photoproduct lyase
MTKTFKHILVDDSVKDSALAKRVKASGLEAEIIEEKDIVPHYRDGKSVLKIAAKKGETYDTCSTMSDKYICCNVKVMKSVSNCPFDCSYCFLQNYLNDGTTSVISDVDAMISEVKEKIEQQPWRLFRIGTWELGDSLALESLTGQAAQIIEAFAELDNAVLELKTKSDDVDGILSCKHGGKTVVAWSMNAEYIINSQEHKTARLDERLVAIKKVSDAGYMLAFHFDPMIIFDTWEDEYTELIEKIFMLVPLSQIAWISVGSLRFNPEMKQKMEANFPAQRLTLAEMVRGDDGKVRYPKPLRLNMYKHITDAIKRITGLDDLSPLSPNLAKPIFYFCMERYDVWEKVLGASPEGIAHLDYLFACSMQARFPVFSSIKPPQLGVYELFEKS